MKLSVGGRIVVRQLVFMVLVAAIGVVGCWFTYGFWENTSHLAARANGSLASELTALESNARFLFKFTVGGLLLGVFLVIGVSMPMMHLSIASPLKRLSLRMKALAAGDTASEIPDLDRKDEIGAIANAVLQLRNAVKRNGELVNEIKLHDEKLAALYRNARMLSTVEDFSSGLNETTSQLELVMQQLMSSSQSLDTSARSATDNSSQARMASGAASSDVTAVALAAEQLQQSIAEIDRQVLQATQIVAGAVAQTKTSSKNIADLSASAQRIEDVIDSISRIAAQTNLLALNATIEAARAGEAGRGFAVVAQEVKALANQTASATESITGQIADIQKATSESVAAIESIRHKIGEVENISSMIASAIHEQSLSTQEITRNVRSAAKGAAAMTSSLDGVEVSVGETKASVEQVASLIDELDGMAGKLRARVAELGRAIEAA